MNSEIKLISILKIKEAIANHIFYFRRELEEEVDGESTFDAETMICAGRLGGHGNACYVRFFIFRHFSATLKNHEVNNHIGGSSPHKKSPNVKSPCVGRISLHMNLTSAHITLLFLHLVSQEFPKFEAKYRL